MPSHFHNFIKLHFPLIIFYAFTTRQGIFELSIHLFFHPRFLLTQYLENALGFIWNYDCPQLVNWTDFGFAKESMSQQCHRTVQYNKVCVSDSESKAIWLEHRGQCYSETDFVFYISLLSVLPLLHIVPFSWGLGWLEYTIIFRRTH